MDPSTPREHMDKFTKFLDEILKSTKIDDNKEDVVMTLRKIESFLYNMIEARNYLHAKDEETIKDFERDVEKKRKDQRFKET